jgi:outer membrane protein with beta-barrel domain
MLLRKILISTAAIIFILYNTALCEEDTDYSDKKVSIALKFGTNSDYGADSDYKDFWSPNTNWTKFWPREASYEYKFTKKIGLELALGYSTLEGGAHNMFTAGDSSTTDLANIYFSPSAKLYFPIKESFSIYGGLGPDLYNCMGDILYDDAQSYRTKSNVSKWGYGAHGMIGAEYFFFKNPAAHNMYNWPVSIELQYKYTWVMVNELDKKLINDMNTELGTSYSANDINVGGHLVTIGVKWHLF